MAPRSAAICAGSSGSWRLRAERFTDIPSCRPACRQRADWRSARSITCSVTGPTSAVCSISEMNCSGGIMPRSRVAPAQQRLHARYAPGAQRDLGLVEERELAPLQAPGGPRRAAPAARRRSGRARASTPLRARAATRARSSAMSARCSSSSASRAWSGTSAIADARLDVQRDPVDRTGACSADWTARRDRERILDALRRSGGGGSRTRRCPAAPTACRGRSCARRRAATSRSTASPAPWPSVSLICLNASRSSSSTATLLAPTPRPCDPLPARPCDRFPGPPCDRLPVRLSVRGGRSGWWLQSPPRRARGNSVRLGSPVSGS